MITLRAFESGVFSDRRRSSSFSAFFFQPRPPPPFEKLSLLTFFPSPPLFLSPIPQTNKNKQRLGRVRAQGPPGLGPRLGHAVARGQEEGRERRRRCRRGAQEAQQACRRRVCCCSLQARCCCRRQVQGRRGYGRRERDVPFLSFEERKGARKAKRGIGGERGKRDEREKKMEMKKKNPFVLIFFVFLLPFFPSSLQFCDHLKIKKKRGVDSAWTKEEKKKRRERKRRERSEREAREKKLRGKQLDSLSFLVHIYIARALGINIKLLTRAK